MSEKNYKTGIEADAEKHIAWDHVLSLPRYAGGHDEIMRGVFGKDSKVVAFWNEGDWQGVVAVAHKLPDGAVCVMTDYYGSCSGCDSYEDANDDEIRRLVSGMVQGSRVFDSEEAAAAWCANPSEGIENYPFNYCTNLKFDEAARGAA